MRIGVLVPVHGFAPYLAETLDAALEQDVGGTVSVVVIDDGSPVPVALHPDHAGRVSLVRREEAGGPAAARATGLTALGSEVELVALCDADDAWRPGALAFVAAALSAVPSAGWAFGRALIVGPDGRPTGEAWARPAPGVRAAAAFGAELYAANPVPTSSVVLRRRALEAVGGFASPVPVAEDWELWLRLCAAGFDAVCVGEETVRYRRHPGGLTADVAQLAAAQVAVHRLHAGSVAPGVAAAVIAEDEAARAAGLVRASDYAGARSAWDAVAAARPLASGERARRAMLRVPGLRARLGRGDPYR